MLRVSKKHQDKKKLDQDKKKICLDKKNLCLDITTNVSFRKQTLAILLFKLSCN